MSVRLLLEGTRSNVEKGWIQGAFMLDHLGFKCPPRQDRDPRYTNRDPVCFCLVGAFNEAFTHNSADYARGMELIHLAIFGPGANRTFAASDAIEWNDTPGRTKEEVIAILDKALELHGQHV